MYRELVPTLDSALGQHFGDIEKKEIYFYCPSCHHHKPKLAINLETLSYQCWVCGFSGKAVFGENRIKSIVRLFYKINNISAAQNLLKSINEFQEKDLFESLESLSGFVEKKETKERLIIPENYKKLYQNRFKLYYNDGYNYLLKRGFHDIDLLKYDIRFNIHENRVLFPSYDSSFVLNYFVSRTIDEENTFKYNNSKIEKSKIVFNDYLVDWDNTIFLVEGIFDAILSRKNSIPLLGSSLSRESMLLKRIIENNSKIILALDPDAFTKQINLCKFLIKNNVNVSYIDWGNETRDIAEMGHVIFNEYTENNVKKYSISDDIINKLKGNV